MGEAGGFPLAALVVEVSIGIIVLVEEGTAEGDLGVLGAAVVRDVAKAVAGQSGHAPFNGLAVEGAAYVDVLAGQALAVVLGRKQGKHKTLISTDAQVVELLFGLGPIHHGTLRGFAHRTGSCHDSQWVVG